MTEIPCIQRRAVVSAHTQKSGITLGIPTTLKRQTLTGRILSVHSTEGTLHAKIQTIHLGRIIQNQARNLFRRSSSNCFEYHSLHKRKATNRGLPDL